MQFLQKVRIQIQILIVTYLDPELELVRMARSTVYLKTVAIELFSFFSKVYRILIWYTLRVGFNSSEGSDPDPIFS